MTGRWPDSERDSRRALLWQLLLLTVLFMVYASFYPFDFDPDRIRSVGLDDWKAGLAWRRPPRSDLIANLIFYLPFGALLTFLTPRDWGSLRRLLVVLASGTLLSLAIECAQLATRDRDPSLTDVVVNGLGTGLAALVALGAARLGVRPALPELRSRHPDRIALLLVVSWLVFHAWPFMPTVRFLRYFQDPALLFGQDSSLPAIAGYLAGYVLLGAALRSLLRPMSFWRIAAACVVFSLLARTAFRGQALTLDEVLGAAAALPVVWAIMRNVDSRTYLQTLLVVAPALAFFALAPFDFSASTPRFQWLPDLDPIQRTAPGEPGLIELFFFYVGCLWLLRESGLRPHRAALWLLGVAVLIELAQAWQPGKTGHIAGPAAVVLGAIIVRARRPATAWIGARRRRLQALRRLRRG